MAAPSATAIVGAALSDVGRVDDTTVYALAWQAASRALADAGLSRHDVDGVFSNEPGILAPMEMAEYLGLRPGYLDGTQVGGSSWVLMLEHATAAIAHGLCEVALIVYASTTRSDLKRGLRTANVSLGARGPSQYDAPWGHTLISKYAMAARRHMHEFGTTIEQLAEVAVSARYNAGFNPEAQYRDPITLDDVAAAAPVADPFTALHCCIRSDGGGAIVVTGAERARDLARPPVWVLGTGEAGSHTTMSQWEDFTETSCVRSGRDAFGRAGVTPTDIDVCQIYDSFTYTVLVTLEGLGFCAKGEGGPFVADGKLRLGGALPTNTDGGGLSACHPGQRAMFCLVEAVRQLRGDCGDRQVPGARLACVNGTGGWFTSTGTAVLGVD